jgi:hypothetical protein
MLLQNANRTCVRELEAAIAEFIATHNQQPKPFVCLNSIGRFASRTLAEHDANNI